MKNKKRILAGIILIISLIVTGVGLIIQVLNTGNKGQESLTKFKFLPEDILYQYNENDDPDLDGLSIKQEKEYGTNPYNYDTDKDSLSDYDEINTHNTDPLKKDSSGDGLSDGYKVLFGLDPLKKISESSLGEDSKRVFEYTDSYEDMIEVKIKGNANIASIDISSSNIKAFSQMNGVLSDVYNIHCDTEFDSAEIKISIGNLKENTDNLKIARFNFETNKFEILESEVSSDGKYIIAETNHFSHYALVDTTKLYDKMGIQVYFVLDNSGSMYTPEQALEYTDNSSLTLEDVAEFQGNDSEFKRIEMTKKFINMADSTYKFGLAKFTNKYTELVSLTNDKKTLTNSLDKIKDSANKETFNGTKSINALISTIRKFNKSDNQNRNYIILLTDGIDTKGLFDLSVYDETDVIRNAQMKNVAIFTIGLGLKENIDEEKLKKIANETGGEYFNATSSNVIEEIYEKIKNSIEFSLVDIDKDGKNDSYVIADSGFLPEIHGFSFDNFSSNISNGQCLGMALFAQKYYTNTLPLKGTTYDVSNIEAFVRHDDLYSVKFDMFNILNGKTSEEIYNTNLVIDKNKKILKYKDEIREQLNKKGWVTTLTKINPSNCSSFGCNYYETEIIDFDSNEYKKNTSEQEKALIKTLSILRKNGEKYNEDIFSSFKQETKDIVWSNLVSELSNKVPVTLFWSSHAVNAIRLLGDLEDPNQFILEIYDNNYSSETRYIYIERTQKLDIADKYVFNNEYSYNYVYEEKSLSPTVSRNYILEK